MKWFVLAIGLYATLISGAWAQGGMGPGPGTVHSIGGGGGTVAVDVKSAAVISTATTSLTMPLTLGASANAVSVMVTWSSAIVPLTATATWNGTTMTAVPGTDTGTHGGCSCAAIIYALLAPATGSHNVVVSWTGSLEGHATAISFTGVNQTSIAVAFPNGVATVNDTAVASPATGAVTSATNHQVIAFATEQTSAWGTISGTLIAKDDTTGPNLTYASTSTAGAATVNPSFAFGANSVTSFVATDVSP